MKYTFAGLHAVFEAFQGFTALTMALYIYPPALLACFFRASVGPSWPSWPAAWPAARPPGCRAFQGPSSARQASRVPGSWLASLAAGQPAGLIWRVPAGKLGQGPSRPHHPHPHPKNKKGHRKNALTSTKTYDIIKAKIGGYRYDGTRSGTRCYETDGDHAARDRCTKRSCGAEQHWNIFEE